MAVQMIVDEAKFPGLRSRWEELFRSNPQHLPYQSWEWNHTWWKHFGKAGDLRLMLVEEDGQLLGIAPLFLARRFRGLPVRHLAFLTHKRADYLDFVVRPGCEAVFFRQLFAHLREVRGDWRFVEFKDIPESSPQLHVLREASARELPLLAQSRGDTCVTLPLARSYEHFLAGLSKRFRKDIGYYRRSFERNFNSSFRVVNTPEEVPGALNDLITVYRARWLAEKGTTHFDEADSAAFEHEVAGMLADAGLYQIYLLYGNGRPAAGILSYVQDRKCYVELFAHSPEFHKYSAGTVLLGMSIEDAIAKGCTELDLMRGDEPYKFRWNGTRKHNLNIRMFRTHATMRAVESLERARRAGSRLRHRLHRALK